ncbi:hypothetical protein Vadar_018083 [Vaccinium darrowii]|uniref:Uncharacterized protein n=1 Tax=Vaccinium darrowii TaxID=229202 RepID=A0ACB7X2E6_9ERIC|nr:hypothetical protein Vadar_018083 [Vaccinium darrowii]
MGKVGSRSKKAVKETSASGVLGKRRASPFEDQTAGKQVQDGGGRGGEKRLVLCQGVGNPLTIRRLKEVCNLYSPDVVFLAETKNKKEKIEKIAKIVRMEQLEMMDSIGLSGGECLMAKAGVKLEVQELSRGIIDVRVTDRMGRRHRMIGIYASTNLVERRGLWRHLANILNSTQEPCVVAGDFNCILNNEEKSGGADKEEWELDDFQRFVDDNDLIDIEYVGYPFTWNNKRGGSANIRMRLDRAVANPRWRSEFPSGSLHHLPPGGSDHCPVLLKFGTVSTIGLPRFIFDSRWIAKEACGSRVKDCWSENFVGSRWFCIQQKIRLCRRKLRHWRATQNLNSRARMKEFQDQLVREYEKEEFDATEYKRVEEGMRQATTEEEEYWRCKSRVSWLRLGDKNTAFFHAKTVQRRAANRIHGLEDRDGVWKVQRGEVEEIICDYFRHMFSSSGSVSSEEVLEGIESRVTGDMNEKLLKPVCSEERRSVCYVEKRGGGQKHKRSQDLQKYFAPLEVADFARDFKVSHYIDSNNSNWKEDLVREAFSSDDAELILGIPISRYEKKDRAVWHFTGNGIYYVKSGYETALTLRRNGQLGMRSTGEGSNRASRKEVWKSVWDLPCQGKIKHFIWKCLHDIVPVYDVLARRKMIAESLAMCQRINDLEESDFMYENSYHNFPMPE